MANITLTEIQNRIYDFIPHMNQSAKLSMVNHSIDYALERISHQHNFTCLRGTSVATATVTAGQYRILETAFGPRVYSTRSIAQGVDWIKDIIRFWLFDTSGNTTKFVKFMDSRAFDSSFDVEEVTGRSAATPSHYTKLNDVYLLNCPTDKAYKALIRYQMYHPRFSLWSTTTTTLTTATSSSTTTLNPSTATIWFDGRDQMVAMNAIVYTALLHLKASLTSDEFPQELATVSQLADKWTQELIGRDRNRMDEDLSLGWIEHQEDFTSDSPYDWV